MFEDLDEKRREILAAMDYAVAEADRAAAEDLLEIYREDRLGLTLPCCPIIMGMRRAVCRSH